MASGWRILIQHRGSVCTSREPLCGASVGKLVRTRPINIACVLVHRKVTSRCDKLQSHPMVRVASFGPKVPDQLSSSSEELPVRKNYVFIYSCFKASTCKCWSGGTNEFLPSIVSGEILSSYCEGLRNVWCTPTVEWLFSIDKLNLKKRVFNHLPRPPPPPRPPLLLCRCCTRSRATTSG